MKQPANAPERTGTRPSATRDRILQGAADAIGRLGYAATRVEDILQAAAVSRPTFYKFFESKEDVFLELSKRHHREIRTRIIEASRTTPDPSLRLLAIVDTFLRWRAELGPIGRVLDLEARTPGSSTARYRKQTLREMTHLSQENLRAAGRPEVDPVLLQALIAVLENVADQLLGRPPVDEAVFERARENALRILAGALFMPGDPVPELPKPPTPGARKRRKR